MKRFAATINEVRKAVESKVRAKIDVHVTDDGRSMVFDIVALPPLDLKLRNKIDLTRLRTRTDLVGAVSFVTHEIDQRLTAEHNKQSKAIAKKGPEVAGYYDESGRPSETLNKLAAAMARRHGFPSGGVVKPESCPMPGLTPPSYPMPSMPKSKPAPPRGSRAEAEAEWKTGEYERFARELTETVARRVAEQKVEEKEEPMSHTTTEQMDMIVAATRDVNANLILFPSEPEHTAIWSSVETAPGEPYELPNEIECTFFRLIYKFRDRRMVLHVQTGDKNEPTLSIPFDVLEDALPVLHGRLEAELQSGGFFGSLKELNAAASKLVGGRAPIGNALEDATYKTVTAATAKRDEHKQVVEQNHYAGNPLYGSL